MRLWQGFTRTASCAVATVFFATAVAACGSSDSSTVSTGASATGTTSGSATASSPTSSATSAVDQTFNKFNQEVTKWPGPTEPVKPPPGKNITVITCGSQGITCTRVANGVTAAGKTLGYHVNVVDGRNDPTVWNHAIRSAVANKTDGIVLGIVPPALVSGAVAEAEKAKIPVIAVSSTLGGAADARVGYNASAWGIANAAFVTKDSGGKANILVIRDDTFPEVKITVDAFESQIKQDCPDCKIAGSLSFSLATASQRLAGDVAQALQKDPSIDYILMPYDAVNAFVIQGIRTAGKAGQVKLLGFGADPPSIKAIAAGDQIESVGFPAEWSGWMGVDALARLFAGQKVPTPKPAGDQVMTSYDIPLRYITKQNLPLPDGWQGDLDYQSQFKKLWGK
jgi:ribose transport system substrate-binding protein